MFEVLPIYQSSNFVWRAKKGFSSYYLGTGNEVTYSFPSAGTYLVTATGDSLCQNVDIIVCDTMSTAEVCEGGQIVVQIPVVADFNYDQNCANKRINFTDTSSKIFGTTGLKYEWTFGEPNSGSANTSVSRNPTHTYSETGNYNVELIITHPSGCTTRKVKTIIVRPLLEVDILTNGNFCFDEDLRFYANPSYLNWNKYKWDFGDPNSNSNSSTNRNPKHTFSRPGTFTVSLTVTDRNNCRTEKGSRLR